ncbi:MAG: sortase [Candidatus Pacebacteria bacterium]|nr:sortase [Candidatus Paceibacterota bacterium]
MKQTPTPANYWQLQFPKVRAVLLGQPGVYQSVRTRVKTATRSLPIAPGETSVKKVSKLFLNVFLSLVSLIAVVIAVSVFAPDLYYQVFPPQVVPVKAQEAGSVLGGDFVADHVSKDPYLPPKNENLPQGDWLIIPKIGVRTQLQATADYKEALDKGLWLVPDFGRPGSQDMPMIVAGHRYGWDWWYRDDYWKYHSFNKLPELEPGDIVEVISDQRKWVYEVYAGEEGEEITDYRADLIMYTCKFLNSPVRHFRYARLIDPTQDSQK